MNSVMKKPAPLAGVFGWPVAHSLSPFIHKAWLQEAGIEGHYHAFAVPPTHLAKALQSIIALGLAGVNVTVPHKEATLNLLTQLDPTARAIGAVNCVVHDGNGNLRGLNTDAFGFWAHLSAAEPALDLSRPIMLCGAGGAARAALYALKQAGAQHITLVHRNPQAAENLAAEFSLQNLCTYADAPALMQKVKLLINATPLGMQGQAPLPIALDAMPQDALVYDLVYTPLQTPLLQAAKARGLKTLDGLGMLVHQAAPSFEHFFGQTPAIKPALFKDLHAHLAARPLA